MKKPMPAVLSLIAIASLALVLFGWIGIATRAKSPAGFPGKLPLDLSKSAGKTGEVSNPGTGPQPDIGAENGVISSDPASDGTGKTLVGAEPSAQALQLAIQDSQDPVAGQTEMVPGHFDGIRVSHVPLFEPPPEVPHGAPRTPPTVIHPPASQGGGTLYLLDSTWDIPLQAPPATASDKTVLPSSPTLTH